MLVLATQKCHLPRAVSWAAPDTQAAQAALPVDKHARCLQPRSGREHCGCAAKHGGIRAHTSPQRLSQALAPESPPKREITAPPVCPPPAPGLPLPLPVPWGSSHAGPTRPQGHSLVAQDDPLDARPEEHNGTDICQAVKESWGDAEGPPAQQRAAGTPVPARRTPECPPRAARSPPAPSPGEL